MQNKNGALPRDVVKSYNFTTSVLVNLITFHGTTMLNETFGSDKLGEDDELLLDFNLKYFYIPAIFT